VGHDAGPDVVGVVLAAGAGERLLPLTRVRPKALCPVANVPLVDLGIARLAAVTADVAVNVHHGRSLMESHLAGRVHLSLEEPEALGTAGALAALREWIDGRAAIVVNADTWCPAPLAPLLDGWDGMRSRVMVAGGGPFRLGVRVAGAVVPWCDIAALERRPSGLVQTLWGPAAAAGRLESIGSHDRCIDCGTPATYLEANLVASGGESVIGAGAVVDGEVVESVVWPGAVVRSEERLVRSIRAGTRLTVVVR
jgi:NDP-sugar pyrophosphorylase family protein